MGVDRGGLLVGGIIVAQKRNGVVINITLTDVEKELLDWAVPLMPKSYQSQSGVLKASLLRIAWEKSGQGYPLPPKFAEMVGETQPKPQPKKK